MAQTKTEFHVEQILAFVKKMQDIQNKKGSGLFGEELDWIEFHAKQIETKCKGCDEAPTGSQNENKD